MSLPAIAIVGYSNSGKTRVATALIRGLSERGYRVAAVKQCHHGHEPNLAAKDSAKLFASGASLTVASSPGLISTIHEADHDLRLEEIIASLEQRYDVVVAEGFKRSTLAKVLVLGLEPVSPLPEGLIAVVGDHHLQDELPMYGFGELDRLTDQIQREIIQAPVQTPRVSLTVDGAPVPLSSFASRALGEVINGYLRALKGIPAEPERVCISLENTSRR